MVTWLKLKVGIIDYEAAYYALLHESELDKEAQIVVIVELRREKEEWQRMFWEMTELANQP